MARFVQKRGQRGSQKWLQVAVEQQADSLNQPIAERLGISSAEINWLSPVSDDDLAEYSDQAFLDCTGVDLKKRPLSTFWPQRGPQWDGLARTSRGDVILVEAKAHLGEMVSPASQASEKSLAQI